MKYVLVTGACGGMGKAAVNDLKSRGYTVFALDRDVFPSQDNIIPLVADITDEQSLKSVYEKVLEYTDTLYAIVHFAGIYMLDSLAEMTTERFERSFRINLFGVFLVNKTFLPLLKSNSRIVITTSELAVLDPLPFTGIYAITKSALDKYAYSLRMELQLLGIAVSVIRAGAVDTKMLGASTKELDAFCNGTKLYPLNAARFRKIVEGVEAKRVPPERIAQKVSKILEKKNPYFSYSINRNPLLLLLDALPKRLRFYIIRCILK